MNDRETRTLLRSGVVLLGAGLLRLAWAAQGPAGPVVDGPSALGALDSAATEAAAVEERASRPLAEGERIDPNRVDAVELRRLPGVGPATARAIVESRERDGPFASAEALTRVRGIGPATLEKLRPYLDLSRAPPIGAVGVASGREDAGVRVDPNRADEATLTTLPGIGPALAARILESRRVDGPFRAADDLLRVRGIGPAVLARLRPFLTLPGG